MNEKTEKIIKRIQALRAISKSTHSRAEAETTIALAAKLIAEYQLSEAELEVKAGTSSEQFDGEHIIYETGRSTPWKVELVWGLAELNGLFALKSQVRNSTTHRQGSRYRIIGRLSDIQIASYMFEYLVGTIKDLGDVYIPSGKTRGVNPERESWCLGCVRGFITKMKGERDTTNKLATSSAMVLISNKVEAAEKAYKERHNIKKDFKTTAPSKAQVEYNAFNSGFVKGKTLTVSPGIETSKSEIKKLND